VSTEVIEVRIWSQRVGAIAANPASGAYAFEYAPEWRRGGVELAPLTMPASAPSPVFEFPDLGDSFHRLPGLVADSLPDRFGNTLIDAWMEQKGVKRESITALDRLGYMGRRGLGALEFHPIRGGSTESAKPLEMQTLVENARRFLHGKVEDDKEARAALLNLIRVGTSAGGARAKAVLAWNPATQEIRSGQFDAEPGFEHWLLKFDGLGPDQALGTSADYGRIEYAYHLLATRFAGIAMAPCRLLQENGRAHFMTRRFDREDNAKHHVQTLCALRHLDFQQRETHAYEQYFRAIAELQLGEAALRQAFRRMAFNVMARNCDDHTKNFAFRLKRGGRWELAPAYDVTHAHSPASEWTRQHLMSVNGKFDGISRADLRAVADRFSVPDAERALADVKAALAAWPDAAREAGLGQAVIDQVASDFQPL
jgi:serine/threonine-protein kinase HipA